MLWRLSLEFHGADISMSTDIFLYANFKGTIQILRKKYGLKPLFSANIVSFLFF